MPKARREMELRPLTGPRVVLRPFRVEDVQAVLAYASDAEVTRHLEWEAYDDPATAAAFIRSTHGGPPSWYAYAVTDRESGALVGGADLRVVNLRSLRTLERVGMRCEGRLINYRLKHGRLRDHFLYAATARPWDLDV